MNCRIYCLKMTLTKSARRLQTYISAILQVSSKLFLPFLQLPLSVSVKTKQPTITNSEQMCLDCALRQPSQSALDTISWASFSTGHHQLGTHQHGTPSAGHPSVLDTISWAPISTGHHQLGILQYWTPSAGHPSVLDTISWAPFSTGHHQLGTHQYWTPSSGHPSSHSSQLLTLNKCVWVVRYVSHHNQYWTPSAGHPSARDTISWASFSTGHHRLGTHHPTHHNY